MQYTDKYHLRLDITSSKAPARRSLAFVVLGVGWQEWLSSERVGGRLQQAVLWEEAHHELTLIISTYPKDARTPMLIRPPR